MSPKVVTRHVGLLARVEAYYGLDVAEQVAHEIVTGETTREAVALWLDECDLG